MEELKIENEELKKELEIVLDILNDLVDVQNGSPLPKYDYCYDNIMDKAYKILEKHKK